MPPRKSFCRAILTSQIVCLCVVPIVRAQIARQIAQNTFPSVVLLVMEDVNGQPVSLGSGFFVREGVIATNLHVIEGATRGYAKLVGQKTKFDIVGIVGIDSVRDLVLLAVTGAKAPSLPLGEGNQVAVGDEVYAVGNPQGLEGTFSQGIVSSVRQLGSDTLLQITAPISPGSSGGPVLNAQGKVIGVAVVTFRGSQNLNFAIPASYLVPLLSDLRPASRLSGNAQVGQERSMLVGFGGRSTEGVVGGQFLWKSESNEDGTYTFSLRNQLRESVEDVRCQIVFYDRNGSPIHVDTVRYAGIIPGGLAVRMPSSVFGPHVDSSVRKLTTASGSLSPSTRIEFRVLDFKLVE
ncbi:MAG: S1C family serine protease [Acidobacteria bacterium]|nr:S1C family serine protease [Acidobacteriota bacterium]